MILKLKAQVIHLIYWLWLLLLIPFLKKLELLKHRAIQVVISKIVILVPGEYGTVLIMIVRALCGLVQLVLALFIALLTSGGMISHMTSRIYNLRGIILMMNVGCTMI